MSDYGAMIILTKISEPTFTDAEKKLFASEIEKIKTENDFADSLGDSFQFIVSEGVGKDFKYLVVILSQYFNGEGDADENFEFAKESDLEEAGKIAEKLQPAFGDTFEIKQVFEKW
ncbi:MAG: hypothetical protein ABIQ40_01575 [Bacteroidia bacterium]